MLLGSPIFPLRSAKLQTVPTFLHLFIWHPLYRAHLATVLFVLRGQLFFACYVHDVPYALIIMYHVVSSTAAVVVVVVVVVVVLVVVVVVVVVVVELVVGDGRCGGRGVFFPVLPTTPYCKGIGWQKRSVPRRSAN